VEERAEGEGEETVSGWAGDRFWDLALKQAKDLDINPYKLDPDRYAAIAQQVAREFAERAVRWSVPRFYDVSDKVVAEALAAADEPE
jgi:hypothetical protein